MSVLKYALISANTRARQVVAVSRAILKNQITFYPDFLLKFERCYAGFVGTRHALSFCNGTSAIEAALFAAGIGPGDEVIVPSCTFHASIDPIVNAGATPVFADVDAGSLTLCADDVARKLTDKTKAVIVVHLFGIPADMAALDAVLTGKNIATIEDASHAHGARLGDRMVGALGSIGVFSLQGNKAVAAGEGGIACTDSEELYLRMSAWGHYDRDADSFDKIGAAAFRHTGLGYKRRMAPLGALLADADLKYVRQVNRMLGDAAAQLDSLIAGLEGFTGPTVCEGGVRGAFYSGYPIVVDRSGVSAADAVAALRSGGFKSFEYPFELHHKLPVYTNPECRHALRTRTNAGDVAGAAMPDLPVTERLKTRLLLLSRRNLITLNSRKLNELRTILDRL